ncbi:MAG: hypothetical protein P8M80_10360 [Pirellulaceae bacterium]|nr:hypothetical protein [Pirellulaceae bacterium]
MDNLDPFIFGCLVFGGGATMMTLHWDKHFKQKLQDRPEEEGQFHAKQYRRRMITSGLITLVGLLFMVYRFLPSNNVSRLWLIAVVLLLIGTILILALIDFRSIGLLYQLERKQAAGASRSLADELGQIKRKLKAKKEASGTSPSESQSDSPEPRSDEQNHPKEDQA